MQKLECYLTFAWRLYLADYHSSISQSLRFRSIHFSSVRIRTVDPYYSLYFSF